MEKLDMRTLKNNQIAIKFSDHDIMLVMKKGRKVLRKNIRMRALMKIISGSLWFFEDELFGDKK